MSAPGPVGVPDRDGGLHLYLHDVNDGTIVVLAGDLDLATAPRLARAVEQLPDDPRPVILDLRDVVFVDSSGVSALLDVERVLGEKRRSLALLQPAGAVTRVLDLVELRSRFYELDRLDPDALSELTRPPRGGPRASP